MKRKSIVSFLAVSALVLGLLSGCGPAAQQETAQPTPSAPATVAPAPTPEATLEEQFDVVIVGAGGAGMSAAIGAYDAGAKNILVVETLSFVGGGTARSGGGFYSSAVSYEMDEGFEEFNHTTIDELYEMGSAACEGADETIQRFYAENVHLYLEKLNQWGHRWGQVYGGNLYQSSEDPVASGQVLARILKEQVDKRNIEVRLNTTATEIVTDESGKITGVKVDSKEYGEYVISCSSVVLASGGFAANRDMLTKYNSRAANVYTPNSQGSMGLGIQMAEKLGAQAVNMDHMYFAICTPENIFNFFPSDFLTYGTILVDLNGDRFVDEKTEDYAELEDGILNATGNTVYAVFSDNIFRAYLTDIGGSDYNVETSTLLKADTLEELAALMNVDAKKLEASVQSASDQAAYKNGPYYALRETVAVMNTMGGLVIDLDTHVYREDGTIIEGLFAAGEITGNTQVSDWYYGVSDATMMGERAGASSVKYVKDTTGLTEHVDVERKPVQAAGKKGNFTDGVYEGTAAGHHSDIKVKVTVKDSSITEIEVLSHGETDTLFEGIKTDLIPAIIANQSTQVDAVSGATFSSNGVIEAINNALS